MVYSAAILLKYFRELISEKFKINNEKECLRCEAFFLKYDFCSSSTLSCILILL